MSNPPNGRNAAPPGLELLDAAAAAPQGEPAAPPPPSLSTEQLATLTALDATLRADPGRLHDPDVLAALRLAKLHDPAAWLRAEAALRRRKLLPAAVTALASLEAANDDRPAPEPAARTRTAVRSAGPYRASEHETWREAADGSGEPVTLASFAAVIVAEECHDDGSGDPRNVLRVEARAVDRVATVEVAARDFPSLAWAEEALGTRCVIAVGNNNRSHMANAIKRLSGDPARVTRYLQTGWRQIDGAWFYLHAGGAIGADGPTDAVSVNLSGELLRFKLPPPLEGEALRAAFLETLAILEAGPLTLTMPLLGAVGLAPLARLESTIWLSGGSGAGKSSLASLAQRFVGQSMEANALPGTWASTGNATAGLLFHAADSIVCVDDYAPQGDAGTVAKLRGTVDRVVRGIGNGSDRQRMKADGTLRKPTPPRALVISTGEDVPGLQSARARTVILEVTREETIGNPAAKAAFRRADDAARRGLFAGAFASYVHFLAGRLDNVREEAARRIAAHALELDGSAAHARTAPAVARLQAGLGAWLSWGESIGALDAAGTTTLLDSAATTFRAVARAQSVHDRDADPASRFVALLSDALVTGSAYVETIAGEKPADARSWGWSNVDPTTGRPRGTSKMIGFVDDAALYLLPGPAFEAAAERARASVPLTLTTRTVGKRLAEAGLLVSREESRGVLTVRRKIGGTRVELWHLQARALLDRAGADDAPPADDGEAPQSVEEPAQPAHVLRSLEIGTVVGRFRGSGGRSWACRSTTESSMNR